MRLLSPCRIQRRSFAACIGLLATSAAAAQEVTVVRSAHMLDVTRGQILSPAIVVIAGGRIQSVGGANVPAGARSIDLGDMTLLPGLIDAHTHLPPISPAIG